MAGEISTPHNNLFRSVFADTTEASALLRAYLPQTISRQLLWSTLALQPVGFIDDRLRDSESDLLYLIQRKPDAAPAWLDLLLEHQSTPDAWLRLRLLKYSIRIWERDRSQYPNEKQLRPIVVYIAATTWEPQRWHRFADAVRRRVPGGGELMNKTEQMLQIYGDVREQEGRQEGELRGKVLTIEAFLGRDVPWTTIEAATGIDQATFHRLKHQLEVADGSSPHPN